jgi:succinoglycan biosynthesis transport protein ExoP
MSRTTVLVVDAGVTRRGAVDGALKRLRGAQANILGGILTKYGQGGSGYGYDYNYSYNYYRYEGDEAEQPLKLGS